MCIEVHIGVHIRVCVEVHTEVHIEHTRAQGCRACKEYTRA